MKIINSIIRETILTFGIIIKELTITACIVLPMLIAYLVINKIITELNQPCMGQKTLLNLIWNDGCGGNPEDYIYSNGDYYSVYPQIEPPKSPFVRFPIKVGRTNDMQNRMTPQDIKNLSNARKVWLKNLKP